MIQHGAKNAQSTRTSPTNVTLGEHIEILEMWHVQNRGNIKAFARMRIILVVIDDMNKVISSVGGRLFVSMLARSFVYAMMQFPPTTKSEASQTVMFAMPFEQRGGAY